MRAQALRLCPHCYRFCSLPAAIEDSVVRGSHVMAVGVGGLGGCGGAWIGQADVHAVDEGGIGCGDIAPIEVEGLEGSAVRDLTPLLESSIEREDAIVLAVEAADEHIVHGEAVVEGYE